MLLSYRNHRIHHSILPDLRHARHAKPAGPGSHRNPVNLRNHRELMLDQYDRSRNMSACSRDGVGWRLYAHKMSILSDVPGNYPRDYPWDSMEGYANLNEQGHKALILLSLLGNYPWG